MTANTHGKLTLAAGLILACLLLVGGNGSAAGLDDYKAANQAVKQKQWDQAARLYQQALDSGRLSAKQTSTAYNNLGVCRVAKGERRAGMRDYGKAIEANPANARAYTNRGVSYGILGDYAAALADHQKAMELREKALKTKQAR